MGEREREIILERRMQGT